MDDPVHSSTDGSPSAGRAGDEALDLAGLAGRTIQVLDEFDTRADSTRPEAR